MSNFTKTERRLLTATGGGTTEMPATRQRFLADALSRSTTINRYPNAAPQTPVAQAQFNNTANLPTQTGVANVPQTPSMVTAKAKELLNMRIAAAGSPMTTARKTAFAQAALPPDLNRIPGFANVPLGAAMDIETQQRNSLLNRALGIADMQANYGQSAERQLATQRDILAEQENARRQQQAEEFDKQQWEFNKNMELQKLNLQSQQYDIQNKQWEKEFGMTASQNEFKNKMDWARYNLDTVNAQIDADYKKGMLAISQAAADNELTKEQYAQAKAELEYKKSVMNNYTDLLKNAPRDPVTGQIDPAYEDTLKQYANESGMAYKSSSDLNRDIAKVPSPAALGEVTVPVGTKTATHKGTEIDVVVKGGMGAIIPAFVGGTVQKVVKGQERTPGSLTFGNYVKIIDSNKATHIYGHLSDTNLNEGDVVRAGEPIGKQGNSGDSRGETGIHLHYQVTTSDGKKVDAVKYVDNYKKAIERGIDVAGTAVKQGVRRAVPRALASIIPSSFEDLVNKAMQSAKGAYGMQASPSIGAQFTETAQPQVAAQTPQIDTEYLNLLKNSKSPIAKNIYYGVQQGMDPQTMLNDIAANDKSTNRENTQVATGVLNTLYGKYFTPTAAQAPETAYSAVKSANNIATIDKALARINWATTGFVGGMLQNTEGTPAYDLKELLAPLKSAIFSNEFAAMKLASKTGSAGLGSLSDAEGRRLESALGSLSIGQSEQQLRDTLNTIKDSIIKFRNAGGDSFIQQVQSQGGGVMMEINGEVYLVPQADVEAALQEGAKVI